MEYSRISRMWGNGEESRKYIVILEAYKRKQKVLQLRDISQLINYINQIKSIDINYNYQLLSTPKCHSSAIRVNLELLSTIRSNHLTFTNYSLNQIVILQSSVVILQSTIILYTIMLFLYNLELLYVVKSSHSTIKVQIFTIIYISK